MLDWYSGCAPGPNPEETSSILVSSTIFKMAVPISDKYKKV